MLAFKLVTMLFQPQNECKGCAEERQHRVVLLAKEVHIRLAMLQNMSVQQAATGELSTWHVAVRSSMPTHNLHCSTGMHCTDT